MGLKWRKLSGRPNMCGVRDGLSKDECDARQLRNSKLAEALRTKDEFTKAEWDEFRLPGFGPRADQWIRSGDDYYAPDANYFNPAEGAPYVDQYRMGEYCPWDALKINGVSYCGWGLDYFGGSWDRADAYGASNLDSPAAHLARKSFRYVPFGNMITFQGGVYNTHVFGPTGGPKGVVPQDGTISWTSKARPVSHTCFRNLPRDHPNCVDKPKPDAAYWKIMPRDQSPCLQGGCNDIDMGTPTKSQAYRKSEAYRSDAPLAWEVCWPYESLAKEWEDEAVAHVKASKKQYAKDWRNRIWWSWGDDVDAEGGRRCKYVDADGNDHGRYGHDSYQCEYQCGDKNCETGETFDNWDGTFNWYRGPT